MSECAAHVIGLVAQWITRLTTDQKIPGSNPGKLVKFLFNEVVSKYRQLLECLFIYLYVCVEIHVNFL